MTAKPRLILMDKQDTTADTARKMADRLARLMKTDGSPLVLSAMPDTPRISDPRRRRRAGTQPPAKLPPQEWAKLVRQVRDALDEGRDVVMVGEFQGMQDGSNKLSALTAGHKSRFTGVRLFNRFQHDTQPGNPWKPLRYNPQDNGAEALRAFARQIEQRAPVGKLGSAAPRVVEIDCSDVGNVRPLADALRLSGEVSVFDTETLRLQGGRNGPRGRGALANRRVGANDNDTPPLNRAALDLLEEQIAMAARLNRPLVLVGKKLETAELQAVLDHARFLTGADTTRWRMGDDGTRKLRDGERALNWPKGRRAVAAQSVAQQVLEDLAPVSLDDLLDLPIEPHKPDRRRPLPPRLSMKPGRKPVLPRL